MNPQYPVYIISKGRWKSRHTQRELENMNVPYHIVIEPQEYKEYAAVISPDKIYTLPFSNLGQGSIPARNWVWEHAKASGAKRHWILDDNIYYFMRWNRNEKIPVGSGTIFRCAEDFVNRYENVALAGFNYDVFAFRKTKRPPFRRNTRIYSCILIDNSLPHRWRGRYNEDTDLSLRLLKDGYRTILFNAFLCGKKTTMTTKGGNTDELYKDDGRWQMAESLRLQHPDVTKVVRKWERWQHSVNYKPFRANKLKLRPGVIIPQGVNNYGMVLRRVSNVKGATK